jgi:hypothetical protein
MSKIVVGLALRDRLGENGTRELDEFVASHSKAVRAEVMDICNARVGAATLAFGDRVSESKNELLERIADLKVGLTDRLGDMRAELLRWSFVFWLGQVAAMFAAMAMFAEWIRP